MKKYNRNNTVIVSVRGGVAEVEYQPKNIEVIIIDYDNLDDEQPDNCPICGEDISNNEIGICDGCGFDLNNDFDDISVEDILEE